MKTVDFIVIDKPQIEAKDLFEITIYAGSHGDYSTPLGSLIGSPQLDVQFNQKLQRIHGKLNLKNLNWFQSWSRLNLKEYKTFTTEQKFRRACSKNYNLRNAKILHTISTGSLFTQDEIQKINQEYLQAIETLRKRYFLEV